MSRRINSLLLKVAKLQVRIEREQSRERPDWVAILRMKLLRLRLRDRLRSALQTSTCRARGMLVATA
jgi:uncharacterized protein YdcH (DUF465 family)